MTIGYFSGLTDFEVWYLYARKGPSATFLSPSMLAHYLAKNAALRPCSGPDNHALRFQVADQTKLKALILDLDQKCVALSIFGRWRFRHRLARACQTNKTGPPLNDRL